MFDKTNLAEISSGGFLGERLIVCRNPLLAAERARKRKDLLQATEAELAPIARRVERRVRAHIFLCMLALYIERHLREVWRELTFADEHPPDWPDPVAKATRSASADAKAKTKRTAAGHSAHTFRSLLAELATQTRNTIHVPGGGDTLPSSPTPPRYKPARSNSPTRSLPRSHDRDSPDPAQTQQPGGIRYTQLWELRSSCVAAEGELRVSRPWPVPEAELPFETTARFRYVLGLLGFPRQVNRGLFLKPRRESGGYGSLQLRAAYDCALLVES